MEEGREEGYNDQVEGNDVEEAMGMKCRRERRRP
jgi:hypothetical protein